MRVTLIEPAMIKREGLSEKPMFTFAPLTLGWLAGITPPDIDVTVFDDRIEAINYDHPADLVGISVKTFTARRAYEIAAEYHRRGVPVVMGGHHPSLLQNEALEHADAVVIGEAESVWNRLLSDAACGRLAQTYQGEREAGFPPGVTQGAVFAGKRYIDIPMLETSRGCPYHCDFCSVTAFFGHTYRQRPAESVVRELEQLIHLNGTSAIFFVDDNVVGNPDSAKALFRALIPLKIRWVGQSSLAPARDPELLDLMQRSGCAGVLVGFESITPQSLEQVGKGWNRQGLPYSEAVRRFREHGVALVGSFIVGFDSDTPETIDATLAFALEQRLFAAVFNLLMPYPNTELYRSLAGAGRLLYPRWWLDPDYTYGKVVFQPEHFSPEDLAAKRIALYRGFYSSGAIARRALDFDANARDFWHLFTYLALNLPTLRQEMQRQGARLGGRPVTESKA